MIFRLSDDYTRLDFDNKDSSNRLNKFNASLIDASFFLNFFCYCFFFIYSFVDFLLLVVEVVLSSSLCFILLSHRVVIKREHILLHKVYT